VTPATAKRAPVAGASRAAAGLASARAEGDRPSFQVLERTFAILEVFDEDRPEWSASEIARWLSLPVPTVHRILTTLRHLGYVAQDRQSKRYQLGSSALLLGSRARAVVDLRSVALGALRDLSKELGETALLTGVSADRALGICLERVESQQPLRLSVEPGRLVPLHAGASQKALLAFMPQHEIDQVVRGHLPRLCSSTITDKRKLRQELKLIAERGFATSFEETNTGVWGVAVPVLSSGAALCAVGVAGPVVRMSESVVRRSIRRSYAAAEDIARALGCEVQRLALGRAAIGLGMEGRT
jgi:IclR family acetate operon transcriptional repressor